MTEYIVRFHTREQTIGVKISKENNEYTILKSALIRIVFKLSYIVKNVDHIEIDKCEDIICEPILKIKVIE